MNNNFLPTTAVPFTNAYLVDVTPELAKEWIALGNANRTITAHRVQKLSEQMKAGLWQHHHEAITFGENGHLIDGLHRLHAAALSSVTVSMLVVINEPLNSDATTANNDIG